MVTHPQARSLAYLASFCLLSLPATPVSAQTVQGTVADGESGVPIYTADVTLLTTDGGVAGRSVTDDDGRFLVLGVRAGTYRLRATRMGYAAFTTEPFSLEQGQDAVADLSLQLSPIPLDPIEATVEATRPRRLVQVGFYRRQERGFGQFLAPEDLEAMHLHFPRDLFWGMSGIRLIDRRGEVLVVKSLGSLMSGMSGGPCKLSVTIDGQAVQGGGNYNFGGSWADLVHVRDIEAVEVYSSAGGVPVEYSRYSPCGAILIWTR